MTDSELLHRFAVERDEESFRTLYASHTPSLYLFALRLLDSAGAAEDAVQEMWIRVSKSAGRFENRSTVRSWLFGILINCCREQRRRSVLRSPFSVLRRTLAENAERRTEYGERRTANEFIDLERAIRALGDGQREVLLLHDVYGYTHEEIGRMLGIDAGTSKSQLARGRANVRQRLGRGGSG